MQKILTILIALTFSHNAFALDAAVENIQALCGLAKEGKQSEIAGKFQAQADGSVKLATVGGKGELSFSKGEWSGLQQILWATQKGSVEGYYACVANALPYFKSKVATPAAAAPKPAAKKTTSEPAKAKSTAPAKPTTPAPVTTPAENSTAEPDADVNVETHGEKSPAINGDGATVNYGN